MDFRRFGSIPKAMPAPGVSGASAATVFANESSAAATLRPSRMLPEVRGAVWKRRSDPSDDFPKLS